MSQVASRSASADAVAAARFEPPVLRSGLVFRPRLLRALSGRWQARVTVVTGGAGLGKTTLLAQALAENRLAPRGEDLWIDAGGHAAQIDGLVRLVAGMVGVRDALPAGPDPLVGRGPEVDAGLVADALWRRSPTEVCMVFDDMHLVAKDSPEARWLRALIEALPSNGHVVLATRRQSLPVPLARLEARSEVIRLGEDDLRFADDELARFAAERGVEPGALASTGGWPALAELNATAGARMAGAFMWEEVLRPSGPECRRALAVLCDFGGGDDALVSAALSQPVDLDQTFDAVPLIARHADGWHVPHALWRDATGLGVAPAEQRRVRTRAVTHLLERERFDEAFRLANEAGLWDLAQRVLRSACLASESHRPRRLGQWLAECPPAVQQSLPGRLATALHTTFTAPTRAAEPLRATAKLARTQGDVEIELCAIAQLGRLGWFTHDPSVLGPDLAMRVIELDAAGHRRAAALAAFGRATMADLAGDDATVLAELAGIETGTLDPTWEVMACWLYGMVLLGLGDPDAVCDLVDDHTPTSDPALRTVLDGLRLRAWWAQGRIDDVLREAPNALDVIEAAGVASNRHLVATNVSILFSHVGDLTRGRACLEDGTAAAPSPPGRGQQVRLALARASLQLAEGDERQAASTLRSAIDDHGLDKGLDRRGWRQLLPLTYVLLPDTRDYWDSRDLRGYLRTARTLAAAVVTGRTRGPRHLDDLDVPDTGLVRSLLPYRFAAELAIGLATCGHSEGSALLDALGPPGRDAIRTLATTPQALLAKHARRVLASLPATPPFITRITALGPFTLRPETEPHSDNTDQPQLRRRRVQELLAFLISHRHTTRGTIAATLWPELNEDLAANNLSVTISHLLGALEPWRRPNEASYLVRTDGPHIHLATGDHLRIDLDDFAHHLSAAARAETDGSPSVALDHYLAAVALYQGNLYADLPDSDWFNLDREHYRTRFVAAATRAAQLCLGQANTDQAEHLAERALAIDPWADDAHNVLIAAALANGHNTAARRRLDHCLQTLHDLGVTPSPTTQQLQQRINGGPEGPTDATPTVL